MSDAAPLVALVGEGPSLEAVEAALGDVDVSVAPADGSTVGDADLAVVTGVTGSDGFDHVNQVATDAAIPWIGIEIGGIGGVPTDTGAVGVFGPDGPCYACLRTRVAANTDASGADPGSMPRSDARFAGAVAGRLAVKHLETGAATGTVIEIPRSERVLHPVPTCAVCGTTARDHEFTLSHTTVSITESADHLERAVDDRLGIISVIGERESYPAPYYLAQLAATDDFSDASVMEHAAGVAPDWDVAYVKAGGEALERYAAGVYREATFETGSIDAVPDTVEPSAFVRPDDAPTIDDEEAVHWVPAQTLDDGATVRVPAAFVVFPPPDDGLAPSITTGLGLGNSTVEAIRSGLSEVIERDAMMLSWYSTYDPIGVRVTDPEFEAFANRCRAEGLSTQLVLLTQDIDVPVVAATVSRDEWPRFAAGTSADLDPVEAAKAALGEAIQNWMELRSLGRDDAAEAGRGVARYAERPGEVTDFFDPDTTVDATTVGPDPIPTGEAAVTTLCDRVTATGLTPYASRLTTRDVAALGFEVTRVLIPRAQPLFVDDPFFGERARTVPRELGYRPRLDRGYHPFP